MQWKLPNARMTFEPTFLNNSEALSYYQLLETTLPWKTQHIRIFGKTIACPRLEAYFSESQQDYSYSGSTLENHPFTPELFELKKRVELFTKQSFNAVLVNYYRDGRDSNGWHADDEKELGNNPVIASLSLGTTRRFDIQHQKTGEKHSLDLTNGSLLIMEDEMQHFWKHRIAKSKKIHGGRINLTFRKII